MKTWRQMKDYETNELRKTDVFFDRILFENFYLKRNMLFQELDYHEKNSNRLFNDLS